MGVSMGQAVAGVLAFAAFLLDRSEGKTCHIVFRPCKETSPLNGLRQRAQVVGMPQDLLNGLGDFRQVGVVKTEIGMHEP